MAFSPAQVLYSAHCTLHTAHCTLYTALCTLHSAQSRGFVTYGLGSKKSLLHDLHEKLLIKHDTVVVHGFFPSLTIKSVLSHISEDILLRGAGRSLLR